MTKRQYLTNEQKLFILQRLACFETPKMVAEALKSEYGITVSAQALQAYDPSKVNGQGLSHKFVEFFEETRKRFREDFTSIPIANKSYRLAMLDRMAMAVSDKGNTVMAAQLLEQAAKEVGDAYTNKHKHELTGKDGAPIASRIETVNPNDAAKAYAEIIKGG